MFDVVIIGSGYGGSVTAARLAGKGRVLLVERGKYWRPGMFAETLPGLVRDLRSRSNPLGLWSLRVGRGVGNAFASAYGGASMVNYGITMKPENYIFDHWPISAAEMEAYYRQVEDVLDPTPSPRATAFGDQEFIDQVSPGHRVDIENTIHWETCTDCGHCVPGCNLGAKRSLDHTYLKMAREKGVDVLLKHQVEEIEPLPGETRGYRLYLRKTDDFHRTMAIDTRQVVIAAGTFGTAELIHRWKRRFPVSPQFGRALSMNGDGLSILYNTSHRLSGHLGAPISTTARLHLQEEHRKRTLTVMSGRIPFSIMKGSAVTLALLANLFSKGTYKVKGDGLVKRIKRRFADLVRVGEGGAVSQTYLYKLDGQDSNRGEMRFDHQGKAVMDWPDYRNDPIMKFAQSQLHVWAEKMGGTLIPDLSNLPFLQSYGVHGLGGCAMGESFETGVVDTWGRIYRPEGGVYPGLRIVDGSVIPTSLGVPPSMTIAAVAERVAEGLARELERARITGLLR